MEKLKFRVSAGLKDIIGRDLITDDYIAIFELVKNSFDAHASRVDIHFQNNQGSDSKIIIEDNGKGMDFEDLRNKWLFVAYSAKKDGTEEESYDYRDTISATRAYAGAKGIGRFSCDRLGKHLILQTRKNAVNAKTEVLITDWEAFEGNLQEEFMDISLLHETKIDSDSIDHGTRLEISSLRSSWSRAKILQLKDSLSKLIQPSDYSTENRFQIFIHAPDEIEQDKEKSEYYDIVNGEVQNFIFETLGLKTTKIVYKIDSNGKFSFTSLYDGGTLIYKIKELNPFPNLYSIEYTLFYLNRSAKLTFSKRMGISSNRYGHVFLYKRGFRVYPYGEPGEDPLKVDVRKQQGHSRYLGNRDLIGKIDIQSNIESLRETTSRGDGLIKNNVYDQLEKGFWKTLRRLEKYVVEVQQWGFSVEDETNENIESRITDLILKLSESEGLVDINYSQHFLSILEKSQSSSANALIESLTRRANETGDDDLIRKTRQVSDKLKEVQQARIEAEKEVVIQKEKASRISDELKSKQSENLFLRSVKSQDIDEIVSFMHSIGIAASNVENRLNGVYQKLNRGLPMSEDRMKDIVQTVSYEIRKILSITRFATKANFKVFAERSVVNLNDFLQEYAYNILKPLRGENIAIHFIDETKKPEYLEAKPIELSILMDNFLSNSIRANSKNFTIKLRHIDNHCVIQFEDDGRGIKEQDIQKVFDLGYTTTSGSGLGLFHVKNILDEMGAQIEVKNSDIGAKFMITL